jgi:ribosomal-protein-alanine N-acetyltransferase
MLFPQRRITASVVRPLRADRAEECARLHASGFAYPWSVEEIVSLIAGPTAIGSAALDPASNKMRGFALSRLAADEAEILTIAVDPAWRKYGVGRDLLRAHLGSVTLAGAKKIFLEVDANNAPALALYRRFQFVKVGERAGYYRRPDGQPATALIMRRDLA